MFNELRYNHLAHGCITLIDSLPQRGGSGRVHSRRRDWTDRLKKAREEYLSTEADDVVVDDADSRAKRLATAILKSSVPPDVNTRGHISTSNDATVPIRTPSFFGRLRRRGGKADEEYLFPET